MKKLLFITVLMSTFSFIQAQRYYENVYDSVITTNDIQYGSNIDYQGNNVDLLLNTYEPYNDTCQSRPLLIMAHGGSFISGSKDDADIVEFAKDFAEKGYFVVSIGYRLGVDYMAIYNGQGNQEFTTAVVRASHDMKAAIRFFVKDRATTNTYKIDASKIIIGGASAGAITAIHAGYLKRLDVVADVVDTVGIGGIHGNSGNAGYSDTAHCIVNLCGAIGDTAWIHSNEIPIVSMHGDQDQTVPYGSEMLVMSGFNIREVDGSHSIMEKCEEANIFNELHTWYGQDHCPQMVNHAYMDTTIWITRDFLANYFFGITRVNNLSKTNFNIYPNPTKNILNIKSDNTIDKVEIIGINGITISTFKPYSKKFSTSVLHLDNGMYFIKINGITTKKFIVE